MIKCLMESDLFSVRTFFNNYYLSLCVNYFLPVCVLARLHACEIWYMYKPSVLGLGIN